MSVYKALSLGAASFVLFIQPVNGLASDFDAELRQNLKTIMQAENDVKQAKVSIEVSPKENLDYESINFSDLDVNKDGVFDRQEVGERLFGVFDRDKNGVIDNLEMKKLSLNVRIPMEKSTVSVIDYTAPGKEQVIKITHDDFLQESKLIKFDKDGDGLSPLDFLEMPFNKVNVRKSDAVIDLYEWKRAYAESVKPLHTESFNYND